MADSTVAHAVHDPLTVAAAADRFAILPHRVASCVACLALLGDLRRIAEAMPSAAIPARPRDFRVRAVDVTMPPRGRVRLVLGWIASPMRMVGAGLSAAGVAGLLLTAAPAPFAGAADHSELTIQAAPGQGTQSTPAEYGRGDILVQDGTVAGPIISGGLVLMGIGVLVRAGMRGGGSLR